MRMKPLEISRSIRLRMVVSVTPRTRAMADVGSPPILLELIDNPPIEPVQGLRGDRAAHLGMRSITPGGHDPVAEPPSGEESADVVKKDAGHPRDVVQGVRGDVGRDEEVPRAPEQ